MGLEGTQWHSLLSRPLPYLLQLVWILQSSWTELGAGCHPRGSPAPSFPACSGSSDVSEHLQSSKQQSSPQPWQIVSCLFVTPGLLLTEAGEHWAKRGVGMWTPARGCWPSSSLQFELRGQFCVPDKLVPQLLPHKVAPSSAKGELTCQLCCLCLEPRTCGRAIGQTSKLLGLKNIFMRIYTQQIGMYKNGLACSNLILLKWVEGYLLCYGADSMHKSRREYRTTAA